MPQERDLSRAAHLTTQDCYRPGRQRVIPRLPVSRVFMMEHTPQKSQNPSYMQPFLITLPRCPPRFMQTLPSRRTSEQPPSRCLKSPQAAQEFSLMGAFFWGGDCEMRARRSDDIMREFPESVPATCRQYLVRRGESGGLRPRRTAIGGAKT